MKRLYFSLLLLVCIATSAKSQVLMGMIFADKLNTDKLEFGFVIGLNYSNLSNLTDTKYLSGLKFGSNFYLKLDERKYLHLELLAYNDHGASNIALYSLVDENLDLVLSGAEVNRRLRYLAAQITYRYRLFDQFYVEIGTNFALLHNAFDEFTKTIGDQEIKVKNDITSQFNRIELGPIFIISYRLLQGEGMNLNFGYYHGLVNTIKNCDIKNTSFQLGVNFPVGGKGK